MMKWYTQPLLQDTSIPNLEHEVEIHSKQRILQRLRQSVHAYKPTLWNISYNELFRLSLPVRAKLVGYMEDVAIVAVASTTARLEWKYNESLSIVSKWMNDKGLKLA